MQVVEIEIAADEILRLITAAERGETIVITRAGEPIAKLTSLLTHRRRGFLSDTQFDAQASEDQDVEITRLFMPKD